jgi:predicted transcriptional regulator
VIINNDNCVHILYIRKVLFLIMLNLEETKNRKMILELINEMPGIRYIELKRITGLAYGTLTYHLSRLEHEGKIKVIRTYRKSRYYPVYVSELEAKILDCLRNNTCKNILLIMVEHRYATLHMLMSILKKGKSTIRYHISRLLSIGVITASRVSRTMLYKIRDEDIHRAIVTMINVTNLTY